MGDAAAISAVVQGKHTPTTRGGRKSNQSQTPGPSPHGDDKIITAENG